MDNPQFKIYRSSAGSGKTYRLSADYLKLALRYPQYYRKILAVTFTNKATWEMKARIIGSLHALALGKAKASLIKLLQDETGWDEMMLKERAGQVLKSILHGFGYFSVSTIDSFFQRVLSAFAWEIEVQGGFTIEFDQAKVTEEIIDMLFLDLENDRALMDWLVRFTESKIEDNKGWDFRREVRDLAGELYYDRLFQHFEGPDRAFPDKEKLTSLLNEIYKKRSAYQSRIRRYGKEGLDLMYSFGVTVDDLYHTNSGPGGLLVKMSLGLDLKPNSYAMEAYHDREKWFSGKCRDREAVREMLNAGLFDLYREAIDYFFGESKRQNTYSQVLKLFYNLGLYSNLLGNLRKYREENGVILISDLSRMLRIIIGQNDAPYIYEKVGSQYQHFLIDEFQDTSVFQWQNFLPLVKNGLSMGNYSMLVGDVKQSIYRWRGGDWQLLQEHVEVDIGENYVTMENLGSNWRSRKNIIDFNNNLFAKLPGLVTAFYLEQECEDGLVEKIRQYSERFRNVYADASQELPSEGKNQDEGAVSVRFLSAGETEDVRIKWDRKVFGPLIEDIHRIQDMGYSLRDIAVLVRTKNEGKIIADYLLGYKNQHPESQYRYDVISSESLFLESSAAVNAVISSMKLVVNEKDTLSLINLHYWLAVLENTNTIEDPAGLFAAALGDGMPVDEPVESLKSYPLIDLLERLISVFGLESYPHEQAYLTGLQNVMLDYLARNKNDLFSFLDWWDSDGRKQSIKPAEGQDAIQILTIHQSKGLEFEMVIIPFCSWNLDHRPNSTIMWCPGKDDLLGRVPYYPVKYETGLLQTDFGEEYLNERSLAYMDNLNLLYVTLTRAISGLFVYAELPAQKNRIKSAGDLLFRALGEFDPGKEVLFEVREERDEWEDELLVYEFGQIPASSKTKPFVPSFSPVEYRKGNWRNKISIRRQPDLFDRESGGFETGKRINYGVMMHDLLSRIFLKEQAEEVIRNEINTGSLQPGEEDEIRKMFEKIWKDEKVADWFSGRWKVRTEVPVLPKSGQVRRMDRVMIRDEHVVVADFKTGRFRNEDKIQVEDYKKILHQMGYKRVEGYLLYLGSGKLVAV